MKKLALFLFVCTFLLLINGCYNYGKGSQYGVLEDISFFTIEGEEIEGEFKDYFRYYEDFHQKLSLTQNSKILPLNSPAPVELYFCADFNEGDDVLVRFTIKCKNGFEFNSLRINFQTIPSNDFYQIEKDDLYTYAYLLYEDINAENNLYEIQTLEMSKLIEGNTRIVNGSTYVGSGRTYLSGYYFRFDNNKETVISA